MVTQVAGRAVLTAAVEQPLDVNRHAPGEAFLLLGDGQPADQEQVFGIGRASDTVLASQGAERLMAER